MRPNKVININPFHFEIQKGILIFWGKRGHGNEKQTYEIHIHFNNEWWFSKLGQDMVDYLKKRKKEMAQLIYNIQSK